MFIVRNFLMAIGQIADVVLSIYYWLILIRVLISWVHADPSNPLVQFLERVTEPVLAPLRRVLPAWRTGIDISPIIAFICIMFLKTFLVRTLFDIAYRIA